MLANKHQPLVVGAHEEMKLELLKMHLEDKGFRKIRTFTDSSELLDFLDETRPWAVVTDINIKGLNGIDLIRRIKQKYKNLPIYVLFNEGVNEVIIEESIKAGAEDVIVTSDNNPGIQIEEKLRKFYNKQRRKVNLFFGFVLLSIILGIILYGLFK
ncbi:response regulator [Marinigracilibium pacificum]|uniref:Response regulator n=1 Tax=Marinigracilibium pacificum TaxID=2729599 RepID=A0A848J217_9BACT|nr:response regulator [Marinigracilibium pacificum]NMM49378.1 response regulator [Marinigracilibium pacificum]